ncbi:MAG: NYN domain-containing protein [Actinomycetota bacterium]|nr:NYN domain-containing protein [Actinomycetota bacterium]
MAGNSPEIESALLRGVGAYLRDVPRNELPTRLRPLAGRHQKMLVARKEQVLGALEDEAFRALVVQWLDDDPPLARADAQLLRIAAERSDGWEGALASKVVKPARRTPVRKPNQGHEVEREKEKARRARDEARKVRKEADRALKAAHARIASLEQELTVAREELVTTRKKLQSATKESARSRAELDRETRKARRRVGDAEKDAKTARKDLSRALKAVQKKSDSAPPRRSSSRTETAAAEPKKRKPLSVPKGRLEDAPETLQSWLEHDHAHLLVDGYNVSKAPGGYGDLELDNQRERVIQEVQKLARRYSVAATIVFDGSEIPPGASRRARGPVAVEYSRAGEIADDHLIAKLEALPKHPVIVVTNDRELQGRARALGATIATSNQLLGLIR